jgi:hypothetical protein
LRFSKRAFEEVQVRSDVSEERPPCSCNEVDLRLTDKFDASLVLGAWAQPLDLLTVEQSRDYWLSGAASEADGVRPNSFGSAGSLLLVSDDQDQFLGTSH